MSRRSIALCIGFVATFTVVSLQAQMGPAAPAPELKKLDFMSGDWTAEGTMNPGPGMPGGKFSETSHAEWMQGNYFLVEHSDGDFGPNGQAEGVGGARI